MGPTAFAVRAECHARAASGGEIIIADVSMSLDNVLAAGDAARASFGPVLRARVLDRAGWCGGRFDGGWLPWPASLGVPLHVVHSTETAAGM